MRQKQKQRTARQIEEEQRMIEEMEREEMNKQIERIEGKRLRARKTF